MAVEKAAAKEAVAAVKVASLYKAATTWAMKAAKRVRRAGRFIKTTKGHQGGREVGTGPTTPSSLEHQDSFGAYMPPLGAYMQHMHGALFHHLLHQQ